MTDLLRALYRRVGIALALALAGALLGAFIAGDQRGRTAKKDPTS